MAARAPVAAGKLLDLLPLLVATFDDRGVVTQVMGSPGGADGGAAPLVVGAALREPGAGLGGFGALVEQALADGAAEDHLWFEGRCWHCRAGRLDDEGGGWLTAADVTSERRHQDRLAEVLAAAPLGVTVFDSAGVVTHAAGSGYALVGLDAGATVGKSFVELYADSADLVRGLRTCLAGAPLDLVTEYLGRVWQVHFRPHLEPGTGTPGGLLIAQDATAWLPAPAHAEQPEPVLPSPLLEFLDRDETTGMPGRRALQRRLVEPLGRDDARALAVIDVDGFARVVATHGPAAGDEVLRTLADRFREEGAGALLGRWHEDEFLAVVEGPGAAARLEELVERLWTAAREPVLLREDGHVVTVSVTVGLVTSEEVPSRDLLPAAHVALRAARRTGPGRIEWYRHGMAHVADPRLARDLALAVQAQQLVLHFQPVMTVEGAAVQGVEGLVRWQHPERGLLMPGEFIERAERTGHIVAMGQWVLREACRVARELVEQGCCEWLAANLSARQLGEPGLVDDVAAALEETGCPPQALVLEVTETAVMADLSTAVDRLERIKALGVRLALDDFGTGYSSLLYLKHFPVDELKIDRVFVRGLGSDPDDTAIVAATVSLARQLGISAVAEGVETEAQLRLLRRLGCDYGQGYLFSRPMPLESLRLWLAARQSERWRPEPAGPEPARVMREVRRMHTDGASPHTIAAALNAAGERTRRGTRWSARSVALLITEQEFPDLPVM